MRTLLQDVRYGARMLRKSPGFSSVIVITLALAIGANTVVFSFTNVLLIRPLPIEDQDRLGWVFAIDPQRGSNRASLSLPDYLDFRESLRSFQSLAASSQSTVTMTGRGDATRLSANRVTANLFDTWGLATRHGRGLAAGDDAPGAEPVVVLSHQAWKRQFNGDPSIVGQSLTLNGRPTTVVGVMNPEIEFGNLALIDIWVPLTLDRGAPRDRRLYHANGRLAPGVTIEQADAEVREVARRLERDHPATNTGWAARVAATKESMAGADTWVILALLTTVVGFVLLMACANIANLVLARATARRRELAVRTALGASRRRVIRQLLTESVALGILGGIAGLAFAQAGLAIIKAAAYEPFFALVNIDLNVLLFTTALAVVTPILFSLVPAIQSSKADVSEALKEGSLRTGAVQGRRSRSVLIVSQLALAMSLLIVSGLLVQTMIRLTRMPMGFDPANLLTLQLEAPDWRYKNDPAVVDYYTRLVDRVTAIPGVRTAAAVDRLPVLGGESVATLEISGYAPPRPDERPWAVSSTATENFFAAAGIPLIAGRGFESQDVPDGLAVAVINSNMARRYWGEIPQAIGGRVAITAAGQPPRWFSVVGVVGDVKTPDLTGVNPQMYTAARQNPNRAMALMVRAADPDAVTAAVRDEVRALDPDVAVYRMRSMQDAFDDELASSRILAGMFVAFAVLALLLAASGLYSVIAYSVSQRVQEIGIRMALGAVAGDIRRLIARQTFLLVTIGGAIGLAGGAALAHAASSVLVDVSPSDPPTYVAVALVLTIVAVAATLAPARRATRIDPLTALRTE
jgi:putative ABC transport system permease protein